MSTQIAPKEVPAEIANDVEARGGSIEPQQTHGSVKSWKWKS